MVVSNAFVDHPSNKRFCVARASFKFDAFRADRRDVTALRPVGNRA